MSPEAKPPAAAERETRRRGMEMAPPDDHVIVLFGATGDLARRKLLPGLFHLAKAGLMPAKYQIIGSSPATSALSADDFRQRAKDARRGFGSAQPAGAAAHVFQSPHPLPAAH